MSTHACPWWLGYLLVTPLRRLKEDPRKILTPYVRPGMVVLEPGPAMGFFTLELARLDGPDARLVAVDLQERMLAAIAKQFLTLRATGVVLWAWRPTSGRARYP